MSLSDDKTAVDIFKQIEQKARYHGSGDIDGVDADPYANVDIEYS